MTRGVVALVLVLGFNWAQAQEVRVSGAFQADSIKIGQPIPFALAVRYPASATILFPDSSFAYAPFEFVAKQYFPTKTTDGISRDSAVYYLTSYEVEDIQRLQLPIFQMAGPDTVLHWSAVDSVGFQHQVSLLLDSIQPPQLPLKVNAFYEPVAWLFNYPIAMIAVAATVVVLVVLWLVFGKRIRRYFKERRLKRNFESFIASFSNQLDVLHQNYSISAAEQAMYVWRKYLEDLEGKPFTKLTSKEIILHATPALEPSLSVVDRALYGGIAPESFDAFYNLKSFSEDCYYKKLESLKHP